MEKMYGVMKLFKDHNMILYDGILYDYKYHNNFPSGILLTQDNRVKGYIEDNIFIITGVVD